MTAQRTPRHERGTGRAVLTQRDEAVLRAVNRFRVAHTSDLRRLLFADRSVGRTAERLRQLFRGGYLHVRVGKLSEENLYSLGPAGKRWLETAGIALGRLPSGNLTHHLAIVSAWARLAAGIRGSGHATLRGFRPDWELRELQHQLRLPVVPDALAEVEAQGRTLRIALEVDLATERHAALRKKFETYRLLRWRVQEAWGWSDLRLVVVVWAGGDRRVAALRRLLDKSGSSEALLSSEPQWPEALMPVIGLAPHTHPAYGKRGEIGATVEITSSSSGNEGELSPKKMAGGVAS